MLPGCRCCPRTGGLRRLDWPGGFCCGGRRGKDRGQEYRGHQAYEAAHPGTEITYRGAYWRAVIREGNGETTVVRYDLRQLLDRLDELESGPVSDEPQARAAEGPPG